MRDLELKLPPIIVVLVFGALMWVAASLAPAFTFAVPGSYLLALVAMSTGAIVSVAGIVQFRQAGTTVNPLTPESSSFLVQGGVYRFTRNPMYLGFLLMLVGWSVLLSNALAVLLLPGFVGFMNRFQIKPEEEVLARLFGQQFETYKSRVRRWL